MRTVTELNSLEFQAEILRALRKLSVEEITDQSNLAQKVRELLEIDAKLKKLDTPLNLISTASEVVRIGQERLDEQGRLRSMISRLCWNIILESQQLFGELLVFHLTKKLIPKKKK